MCENILHRAFRYRGNSKPQKLYKLQVVSRNSSDRKSFEFIVLDSKELCVLRSDGSSTIRKPNKNIRGMHVLRDVCYHTSAGVHLLASIGKVMSILVLNATVLDLVGSIPMGQHVVQNLAYMCQTEEILTGGSMGLRSFRLCGQPSRNGRTRRWILQLTCIYNCAPWVNSLRYHEHTNTAVVVWPQIACVDLFDTAQSKKVARLAGALHEQQITDAIFFPRSYYFITSCLGGYIKIWYRDDAMSRQIHDDTYVDNLSISHLHTFRGHRRGVMKLDLHPNHPALFLSASLDGSLRIWNGETLVPISILETSSGGPLIDLVVMNHGDLVITAAADGSIVGYSSDPEMEHTTGAFRLEEPDITSIQDQDQKQYINPKIHTFTNNVSVKTERMHEKLSPISQIQPKKAPQLQNDKPDNVLQDYDSADRTMYETLEKLRIRKSHKSQRLNLNVLLSEAAMIFVHKIFCFCLEDLQHHAPRRPDAIIAVLAKHPIGHARRYFLGPARLSLSLVCKTLCKRNSHGRPVLAPHFFLRQALCRARTWTTSPLC